MPTAKQYSANSHHTLLHVEPMRCGCRYTHMLLSQDSGHHLAFTFCSMHDAAPEMLEALDSIARDAYPDSDPKSLLQTIQAMAKFVVKKAERGNV
jgi:hypothetical protein